MNDLLLKIRHSEVSNGRKIIKDQNTHSVPKMPYFWIGFHVVETTFLGPQSAESL